MQAFQLFGLLGKYKYSIPLLFKRLQIINQQLKPSVKRRLHLGIEYNIFFGQLCMKTPFYDGFCSQLFFGCFYCYKIFHHTMSFMRILLIYFIGTGMMFYKINQGFKLIIASLSNHIPIFQPNQGIIGHKSQ